MASSPDGPRFFNVWLVQPNTVYRSVPFTVVCDWIQEGRLLKRDCVRSPGATAWEYLDEHPLFAPYFDESALPRPEDPAEAMEPIEGEFQMPAHHEDTDEEVDMIPLIDISMVLLVFFMMTAQDLLTSSPIDNPSVAAANVLDSKGAVMVGLKLDPANPSRVVYYVGDSKEAYNKELTEEAAVNEVKAARAAYTGASGMPFTVIVQAEGKMSFEVVQRLTIKLELMGIKTIRAKVKQKPGGGGEGG